MRTSLFTLKDYTLGAVAIRRSVGVLRAVEDTLQ